jgi:hypothetical protein
MGVGPGGVHPPCVDFGESGCFLGMIRDFQEDVFARRDDRPEGLGHAADMWANGATSVMRLAHKNARLTRSFARRVPPTPYGSGQRPIADLQRLRDVAICFSHGIGHGMRKKQPTLIVDTIVP